MDASSSKSTSSQKAEILRRDNRGVGPGKVGAKGDPAAVESGATKIRNHLQFFSQHLGKSIRGELLPKLSTVEFQTLHKRNQTAHGHHFVVHQHDHPIAGTHYDLRLQINETSSASWAIMCGLPGNPNSRRLNRNATETRIYCLWNHLIETASHATGSMLIWDTGEYEVLPYYQESAEEETDRDSLSSMSGDEVEFRVQEQLSEPDKLYNSFQKRKIRLRLHGYRLPRNYTISLRMSSAAAQPKQARGPPRKRRRRAAKPTVDDLQTAESEIDDSGCRIGTVGDKKSHSDNEEDDAIRTSNAYTGATNTIGSIHQRTWYMSLDRDSSGFQKQKSSTGQATWARKDASQGFDPFHVRGRDFEQSVLTGRQAKDVLEDEGVEGYIGRAGWTGVLN